MYRKKQTLEQDFGIWWNMPKYKNRDFEARKYANNMIVDIGLGNYKWPGPEKDVKYFVVLDNGKCVGMHHLAKAANVVQSMQNFLYTIILLEV